MTNDKLRDIIYKKLQITELDENIERLTQEQMKFIVHDINLSCFIEACPGSGKTEVVGIKSAYELIDWGNNFVGLAIVSFSKNASKEIENRVKKYAGTNAASHPHFIGTFDSFLYKYVLCPFFHGIVGFKGKNGDCSPRAIIDEKSDADFLENTKYKPKTRYAVQNPNRSSSIPYIGIPITANRFYYDIIKNDFIVLPTKDAKNFITLQDILKRPEQIAYHQQFSWLTYRTIRKSFVNAKKAFWEDGFLTFRDFELIVYLIIKKNIELRKTFTQRFPYLIIDECQDLSPIQLVIIDLLGYAHATYS